MKFEIKCLQDLNDCETCGWSYATGYKIYKDGEMIVDKTPIASCFDSVDYSADSPYQDILNYLHPEIDIAVTTEYGNE